MMLLNNIAQSMLVQFVQRAKETPVNKVSSEETSWSTSQYKFLQLHITVVCYLG